MRQHFARSTARHRQRRELAPWRGLRRGLHREMWSRWAACLLLGGFLALLLGGPIAAPTSAQTPPTAIPTQRSAPVVVDGQTIFMIQGRGSLTAAERARQINRALAKQVRSPDEVAIEVVQQDSLAYLQSANSSEPLVTVVPADVETPGRSPVNQGRRWARALQQAVLDGQRERQPRYLRQAALYSLAIIAGAIVIQLGLQVLGRIVSRRLALWFEYRGRSFNEWERPVALFWRLGLLGVTAGLWLTVAFYVTDVFPQARQWRYTVGTVLDAEIINLGEGTYSALDLLLIVGVTVGLWFATSFVTRLIRLQVLERAQLEKRVQDILSVLIHYALLFVGIMVLLQAWGIDLSSLAILASVLGVGIGFGVQNITNNLISGFIITVESPIQVGDFINVGDLVGTVEKIGARSTEIRTLDRVTIIVPNSRFLETEVINWSHGSPVSRLHVPVSVAYGSDLSKVKTALLEAIRRHPEVLLRPAPEVWFQGFGDSALDFEIMVWTGDPRKQFRVRSDLNYEIEASLRRYNIEIPFPQRDLHLRSPQLDELIQVLKLNASGRSRSSIPSSAQIAPSDRPDSISQGDPHAQTNFSDQTRPTDNNPS